jgi:hypothetical protein
MKRRLLKGDCVLSLLILWSAVTAWSAPFQLVSKRGTVPAPSGGSGDSWGPIISPDGRFVLFASTANNLVSTTNGHGLPIVGVPRLNVFVRDRTNNTTTLVSANLVGTGGGNGDSIPTALSTNGRFACFESSASDLIPNDTNGVADVFVRDLQNNTAMLVSVATNGAFGNGECRGSVMTPDGRYVAFISAANSLVPNDTNNIPDVFVRDLQSGVTTLVSVGARSTNSLPLSSSESPEITPDGRYIAYYSSATNLVPWAAHGGEIYVRDLVGGTTIWASTNAHTFMGAGAFSYNHAISADGLYVVYEASSNAPATTASRLGYIFRHNVATATTDRVNTNAFVPPAPPEEINTLDISPDGRFIAFVGNTNGTAGTTSAIFRWDGLFGTTLLISGDMAGNVPANSVCDSPKIDPTGQHIAFLSTAPNLATNAPVGGYHLYLRDTIANLTTLLDAATNGTISSTLSPAATPRMDENGDLIAFDSFDASFVANDLNHDIDVFVRDVSSSSNILISAHHPALVSDSPNGSSVLYSRGISADGRCFVFSSEGDNLVSGDTNGFRDVFARDRVSGTNILVSVATNGSPGGNLSYEGALSANGRFVVFTSSADNLVASDSNKREDVFVRDLVSNTTTLVSINLSATASGNQGSHAPAISADGRYVTFRSSATDIASGSFSSENLFVRDMNSAVTYALTTSGVGSVATTRDGRYVVFNGGPSNTVYVWDTSVHTSVYTNVTASSVLAVGISDDGNHLAYVNSQGTFVATRAPRTNWMLGTWTVAARPGLRFSSSGNRLTYSRPLNSTNQVYLYDLQTGTTLLVSRTAALLPPAAPSDSPAISVDGRFIVYRSFAADIVSLPVTNRTAILFFYDSQTDSNSVLSQSLYQPGYADNRSASPLFSGDGRTVMFQSVASDLSSADFNHNTDVFALALLYASITAGLPGQGPTISWPARPGETYHVQFKNKLTDPNWQEVAGVITITVDRAELTDLAPSSSQRFYRVSAN